MRDRQTGGQLVFPEGLPLSPLLNPLSAHRAPSRVLRGRGRGLVKPTTILESCNGPGDSPVPKERKGNKMSLLLEIYIYIYIYIYI